MRNSALTVLTLLLIIGSASAYTIDRITPYASGFASCPNPVGNGPGHTFYFEVNSSSSGTLQTININVSTGASVGGLFALGIYNDSLGGGPGTWLGNTTNVTVALSGQYNVTVPQSITIAPSTPYWLVEVQQMDSTFCYANTDADWYSVSGFDTFGSPPLWSNPAVALQDSPGQPAAQLSMCYGSGTCPTRSGQSGTTTSVTTTIAPPDIEGINFTNPLTTNSTLHGQVKINIEGNLTNFFLLLAGALFLHLYTEEDKKLSRSDPVFKAMWLFIGLALVTFAFAYTTNVGTPNLVIYAVFVVFIYRIIQSIRKNTRSS